MTGGESETMPRVAEKLKKAGRKKVRHKAENLESPEDSDSKEKYTGLTSETRERVQSYENHTIPGTEESMIYATPHDPREIRDQRHIDSENVYYNISSSMSEYKNL